MIDLLKDDDSKFLVLEKLSEKNLNETFSVDSQFEEYKDFLYIDALLYQSLFISKTYLLLERETRNIVACDKAYRVNDDFMACRVVSVDADIERNPKVVEFYQKNGFMPLKSNIYKRKFPTRTKIIGMWKNIL